MEIEVNETAVVSHIPAGDATTAAADAPVTFAAPPAIGGSRKIKEGDNLILCLNEDKFIFAFVSSNGTVNVNKRRYPLRTLIGAPYRSLWEAPRVGKTLVPLKEKPRIEDIGDVNPTEDAEITADNRDLVDDNQSQKLTQQEIVAMQTEGASGEAIIKALIQNSATYHGKTEFSKAKYLKKKAKKHIQVLEVLEPSLDNITAAYFNRKPSSVCHLRVDSLARMLTFSDARAGSNVLVIESCKGIVTGAIAERLGGHGHVVSLHLHGRSNVSAIDLFNFSEEIKRGILHAPLASLRELHRALSAAPSTSDEVAALDAAGEAAMPRDSFFTPFAKLREVFAQGFDSLVIAVKAVPAPFLWALLPFIKPSSPFVVFSPFMQQLVDCYMELQRAEEAVNMQLSETWMRQYQVLPSRTRPPMNMHGASGFVLTGTKIYNGPSSSSSSRAVDALEELAEEDSTTTSSSRSSSSSGSSRTSASPLKKKARTESSETPASS